jgi:hypothetical protein
MAITCDIVICGRIRRRLSFFNNSLRTIKDHLHLLLGHFDIFIDVLNLYADDLNVFVDALHFLVDILHLGTNTLKFLADPSTFSSILWATLSTSVFAIRASSSPTLSLTFDRLDGKEAATEAKKIANDVHRSSSVLSSPTVKYLTRQGGNCERALVFKFQASFNSPPFACSQISPFLSKILFH